MEEFSNLKRKITIVNKKCDLDNKSLFEVLCEQFGSIDAFLKFSHFDISLLDELSIVVLDELLRSSDARIEVDPNKESWNHGSITIFSESQNITFIYVDNNYQIVSEKKENDKEFNYFDVEYLQAMRISDNNFYIHVATSIIEELHPRRIITKNYPLKYARFDIQAKYGKDKNQISIIIEDDLLRKDYERVISLIYRMGLLDAVHLLKEYPSMKKTISNDVVMNNFMTK